MVKSVVEMDDFESYDESYGDVEVFDYGTLKDMAKNNSRSVDDFLVLTSGNDPFYVGSGGQMVKAKWFARIYGLMGSPEQCHIRRVHYWLVSQPDFLKPDGVRYLNTVRDYEFLNLSAKYARYAGLVPVENIIDRRNPAPIVNASSWKDEVPSVVKDGLDEGEIVKAIVDKFYCFNPHNTQSVLMELWCEKSTMNDVLVPIAEQFGLNLVTGLGELSITAVNNLIGRIVRAGKPVRIFYISDFDPAGECMPVSVSRKIEYFMRSKGIVQDVKLKQIMLTAEQCKKFNLPRTPIKDTELRKAGFEDKHGAGATELDALEALHSGEMAKIVNREIGEYFDVGAWNSAVRANRALKRKVEAFLKDKIGNVLEKLDVGDFDKKKMGRGGVVDFDFDKPWLYDSELSYFEQLNAYDQFKSGRRR